MLATLQRKGLMQEAQELVVSEIQAQASAPSSGVSLLGIPTPQHWRSALLLQHQGPERAQLSPRSPPA